MNLSDASPKRWQDPIYLRCPNQLSAAEEFEGHVKEHWCKMANWIYDFSWRARADSSMKTTS